MDKEDAIRALLARFVNRNPDESNCALIELICIHALPEIKRIVDSRRGRGIHPQDCEDVQSAAKTNLTSMLLRRKPAVKVDCFKSFKSLVRTAARNAVSEHIRGRGFRRAKYYVRRTFDACEDLQLWENEKRRQVGGFSDWRGRRTTPLNPVMECIELKLRPLDFNDGKPDAATCMIAVKAMLNCAGNPVFLGELCTVFGAFAGMADPVHVSVSAKTNLNTWVHSRPK